MNARITMTMKPRHYVLAIVISNCLAMNVSAAGGGSHEKPVNSPERGLMDQARGAITAGQYEAAIGPLSELVAKDPKDADALTLLGYSHRKLKRYPEAENYYGRALAAEDDHVGALEYLGELYVETGRTELANKLLERIDDACFFHCDEYDALKAFIESQGKAPEQSGASAW